jgi:nucleoside-diphosphate-sugar epimerase
VSVSRTLVTGAAGFLGAHLCRRLAEDGHEVIALDCRPRPTSLPVDGIHYLQADLREPDRWRPSLEGVATVFHLASVHLQVHAPESEYRSVNVDAAVGLAEASHQSGVSRFVHVSTVGIYGHVGNPPANEDAPRNPTNAYERTKLEGEQALALAAERLGLHALILRPAWIFGPGCPRTAKLLRSIRRRQFFFVGSGRNLRHPVYVDDVVDALLAAARGGSGNRRDYIIAGPTAMTLRDVVNETAAAVAAPPPTLQLPRTLALLLGGVAEVGGRLIGRDPPFSRRSIAFFENDNAFDGTAARNDLDFRPRVSFSDGLRRTLTNSTWPLSL